MKITLKGYGLGDYGVRAPMAAEMEIPADATVLDILKHLSLSDDLRETLLVFVNGRPMRPAHPLSDGDTVVVFPPFEGG